MRKPPRSWRRLPTIRTSARGWSGSHWGWSAPSPLGITPCAPLSLRSRPHWPRVARSSCAFVLLLFKVLIVYCLLRYIFFSFCSRTFVVLFFFLVRFRFFWFSLFPIFVFDFCFRCIFFVFLDVLSCAFGVFRFLSFVFFCVFRFSLFRFVLAVLSLPLYSVIYGNGRHHHPLEIPPCAPLSSSSRPPWPWVVAVGYTVVPFGCFFFRFVLFHFFYVFVSFGFHFFCLSFVS